MILQPTKYVNTHRTLSALVNDVYQNDVILLCDTTLNTISLNLLELVPDHWNTVYKLFIVDHGNNAAANNITINAPAGYTINGQPSITINVNGGTAIVRIANNEAYLASLSYGTSAGLLAVLNEGVLLTPQASSMNFTGANVTATNVGNAVTVNIQTNFISVTYAQLTTLINTNAIIPDQDYEILDAEFGSTPIVPTKVYVQGITTNSVAIAGNGIFYNADYMAHGDYSGIPGFVANLGVWDSGYAPVVNNVVIWNNFHYVNITGANGVAAPPLDAVNWTFLPLSATNGYIVEVDTVEYSQTNNQIMSREDRRYNRVERAFVKTDNNLNVFKWGDNRVFGNSVLKFSIFYNCNTIIITNVAYNNIVNTEWLINKPTGGIRITSVLANIMEDSMIISALSFETFQYNHLFYSTLNIESNTCSANQIIKSSITITGNTGVISENTFNSSTLQLISNSGSIRFNSINDSTFRVLTSNSGTINYNDLSSGSELRIGINATNKNISYNTICQSSSLLIDTNNETVNFLNITSNSSLTVQVNDSIIGDTFPATKGGGVHISSGSTVALINNTEVFTGCVFDNYSVITIGDSNGAVSGVQTNHATITITTNTNGLENFKLDRADLILAIPAQFINGGEAVNGNGSIQYTIDCADPTIYDLGTLTLTIPSSVSAFAGIITLANAGGLNIEKIVNLNDRWLTTLNNNAGTTTFTTTAVGAAVASDVISSYAPLTALAVVYRANGGDSILFRATGTFSAVEQVNIYS